jgi:hypothetical protein
MRAEQTINCDFDAHNHCHMLLEDLCTCSGHQDITSVKPKSEYK